MEAIRLTIIAVNREGEIVPPRTKKNSAQLIPHMKHPLLVPSEAYRQWERAATREMLRQGVLGQDKGAIFWKKRPAIVFPVNCQAIIYRDANRGDLIGFLQGLADWMEDVGILSDDRFIQGFDGSRMAKDAARPRVEVELTALDAAPLFGE